MLMVDEAGVGGPPAKLLLIDIDGEETVGGTYDCCCCSSAGGGGAGRV